MLNPIAPRTTVRALRRREQPRLEFRRALEGGPQTGDVDDVDADHGSVAERGDKDLIPQAAARAKQAFWPPKPNEFDSAKRTLTSRDSLGT